MRKRARREKNSENQQHLTGLNGSRTHDQHAIPVPTAECSNLSCEAVQAIYRNKLTREKRGGHFIPHPSRGLTTKISRRKA